MMIIFTDTVYTERYMGLDTRDDNFKGYDVSPEKLFFCDSI